MFIPPRVGIVARDKCTCSESLGWNQNIQGVDRNALLQNVSPCVAYTSVTVMAVGSNEIGVEKKGSQILHILEDTGWLKVLESFYYWF